MALASEASLLQQAVAFHREGKLSSAQRRYQDVIKINPRNYDAQRLLGVIEYQRGNHRIARRILGEAIAMAPQVADSHYFLGRCLSDLNEPAEAIAAYEACLRCDPRHENAAISLGIVLGTIGRSAEALKLFDAVIAANPRQRDALLGRGGILLETGDYSKARDDLERCLQIDPDLPEAQSYLVRVRLQLADWRNDGLAETVLDAVRRGEHGVSLPAQLALETSPQENLASARAFAAKMISVKAAKWSGSRSRHDRIRIAYLSSDFRPHAVGHIAAGLFENHDAARFDISAVSLDLRVESDLRRRIEASVPRFLDVHALGDDEIAARLREWEIDIAVNLNGHTFGGRTGILARRPAPIQVNYLGFPGSMGVDFIDYIIGDQIVIPDDHRRYFSEKVVTMPHAYFVTDNRRAVSPMVPTRADQGLPENGFVFCAFTSTYKITPAVFSIWMELLAAVDGSVMWFSAVSNETRTNLLREAQARGISENRIVFAVHAPRMEDHLARHALADLFLDTTPYNAHSTAADALWTGLPVITCLGGTFPGRVAASVLANAGLPELVTSSLEEYRALAVKLAREPELLASYRERLQRHRQTHPLFDTPRFVRHLEAAYVKMYERHLAGLRPDHLTISE